MKGVISIIVEDPSSPTYRKAMKTLAHFSAEGLQSLGNGTRTKLIVHDVSDPSELSKHIGQLTMATHSRGIEKTGKRKGFWHRLLNEIGDGAADVLELKE